MLPGSSKVTELGVLFFLHCCSPATGLELDSAYPLGERALAEVVAGRGSYVLLGPPSKS